MERFILLIAHYILISSTTSLRGINLESFARSFSLTSVTQRGLGSPASTSPCHSPPTRHVVLDHHHESHPILPGLKLILGPSRDHNKEPHRMSRRTVQYRHAHHLRPHTLLQLVAKMVEPGQHHLQHRVRQGVQDE